MSLRAVEMSLIAVGMSLDAVKTSLALPVGYLDLSPDRLPVTDALWVVWRYPHFRFRLGNESDAQEAPTAVASEPSDAVNFQYRSVESVGTDRIEELFATPFDVGFVQLGLIDLDLRVEVGLGADELAGGIDVHSEFPLGEGEVVVYGEASSPEHVPEGADGLGEESGKLLWGGELVDEEGVFFAPERAGVRYY